MTPLNALLLFVALLVPVFLIEAIRFWEEMWAHDRAWAGGPKYVGETRAVPVWSEPSNHPDLIVDNLSEVELRIIADVLSGDPQLLKKGTL